MNEAETRAAYIDPASNGICSSGPNDLVSLFLFLVSYKMLEFSFWARLAWYLAWSHACNLGRDMNNRPENIIKGRRTIAIHRPLVMLDIFPAGPDSALAQTGKTDMEPRKTGSSNKLSALAQTRDRKK